MAWWYKAQGYIANGYGTTYGSIIKYNIPKWSRWSPFFSPQRGCQCSACVHTAQPCLLPAKGGPITPTKKHPHTDCSANGTKRVWETVRWHGINWENVPTGHLGRYLYANSQLSAIGLSHLLVEMQAGSIIYPVTATGLVTGMSSLFSIMKRNWTNWTDWHFWMRKTKSLVSCK